ncbi:acylneuraminate cytidylyltransferase [uncultured Dysgonomonas sp.]|uniref:N-acylneuraminate cytidylyltransferase n=1 Tax=uncultured Dysgonomonas sp. TaxID=206096 RepID=A0A212K0W4_9BACT|nr:acylneuraminate cytidylyltransferase [uncultured Dysgonomonas sp.]SBW05341.1 3-deoxy-D-manno-octulosonate 8-phosphate phosphatase YrbI family [uncultured Dysgonomonas sp.]
MSIIAFIPVRGGSKSIPHKNIKSFCGKPLVFWTLGALQDMDKVDEVVVATDCDEIEDTILQFNFSKVRIYRRLPQNATDTASTESVMLEYIKKSSLTKDDYFILVQATSPFTQKADIEGGLNLLLESQYDSVLSTVRFKRFLWNNDGTPFNYDFKNRPRRQDFDGKLMENGAFYINTVGNIIDSTNRLSGKVGIYEMPDYTAVEIDELEDWSAAEDIMRRHILKRDAIQTHNIKLFLTDVDGVLTDAGMYYSENGDELKKFNTRDGMGIRLLKENGIKTGIITSENTKIVENRAKKLNVDYLYQGKISGGKLDAAKDICKKESITLQEVAYIGDDLNCFDLLSNVGLAACPSDAVDKVKGIPNIKILNKRGGEGVVREFIDNWILA